MSIVFVFVILLSYNAYLRLVVFFFCSLEIKLSGNDLIPFHIICVYCFFFYYYVTIYILVYIIMCKPKYRNQMRMKSTSMTTPLLRSSSSTDLNSDFSIYPPQPLLYQKKSGYYSTFSQQQQLPFSQPNNNDNNNLT